jgi:predicted nucleic acid-binding protein
MAGIKNYLVDTDIFIDYFNGKNWAKAFFTDPPGRLYYSKITRKELLSITGISGKEKKEINKALGCITIIDVDNQIAAKASEIIQNHKIQVNDALIASTALVKNMTLVTRNQKHFRNIHGIELLDHPEDAGT